MMTAQKSSLPHKAMDLRLELEGICKMFASVSAQHIDSGPDLLVTASKYSTRIIGHPSSRELQILYFEDKKFMPRSKYNLHGTPNILSLNCEENILAVNYKMDNLSFVDIFAVNSFMSGEDLRLLFTLRFDCMAKQISWNPGEEGWLAICLNDGSLFICILNAKNEFILRTIEVNNARCVSWSSQGNVIVVAFPNGIFRQYCLEIGSIRYIESVENLFDRPFEPIALQWLSTNQFAAIFLENADDAQPTLYIINGRDGEQATFIRIEDAYYSSTESQVYLLHLPKWNLILTGSRSDAEINILTTDGTSDTPSWMQLNFVEQTRARLPLAIEDRGPFSMLGIALENPAPQFSRKTPLISIILTCGRLLTVKLKLAVSDDANEAVFGAGSLLRRSHRLIEVKGLTEHRILTGNFPVFEELTISHSQNKEVINNSEVLNVGSDDIETGFEHLKIEPISDGGKWVFQTKSERRKKPSKPRPFVCDICDNRYVWKEGLRHHILHAHMERQLKKQKTSESHPFVCGICGHRYTTKCGTSKHIRKVHVERRSKRQSTNKGKENHLTNIDASCLPTDTLNKRSRKPKAVEIHKDAKSHPHLCDICGERYKHIGKLIYHQQSDHAIVETSRESTLQEL